MGNDFVFYPRLDSTGYDLCYLGRDSVERMKVICLSSPRCVGFNTLGFYKFHIRDESDFQAVSAYTQADDGMFVHRERFAQSRRLPPAPARYLGFDDYRFYPGRDSPGHYLRQTLEASLDELKALCDRDRNCVGFNTLGFLKYRLAPESDFVDFYPDRPGEGLYVKKSRVRVKLICNWCSPEQLCREWNHMSQGDRRWNDIEVTWEDRNVDFYVIVNRPSGDEFYDPARTIVFQMEPWCGQDYQTWGVKTWGAWAEPDEATFLQVRAHRRHVNNAFWQLRSTYHDLKTIPIVKTHLLSTICSSKYFDPGHLKRVDFLKYVEQKRDDVVRVDLYAHDNRLGFTSYRGPHPPGDKGAALLPYKYCFMAENNQERNFITEKLWEPLLAECLCFYWGGPNVSEYIDPRAYIQLDLDDFEESFQIMRRAILAHEWEKRVGVIRAEKQKVLDYYQFFPALERILRHELKLPDHPSDEEVTYHKYFHRVAGRRIRTACFIHSCVVGGETDVLDELIRTVAASGLLDRLDCVFVVNVGDPIGDRGLDIHASDKIFVIDYSKDVRLHERPTLNLLRLFCRFHGESQVLYLHTKGVTHRPPRPLMDDWRSYMLYFLVEHHEACLSLLEHHDVVGCNLLETPRRHFGGNFWWSHAHYVATLDPILSGDRYDCEWWILNRESVKAFPLWDSGVNHYERPYPRETYDTAATRETLEQYAKAAKQREGSSL